MCNIAIALPQWIKSTHVILNSLMAVMKSIAITFLYITFICHCYIKKAFEAILILHLFNILLLIVTQKNELFSFRIWFEQYLTR